MKLRSIIAVILVASMPFIAGCLGNDDDGRRGHPVAYESTFVGINDVVNSTNEFSYDMYRELLNTSGSENVFFSPYSVAIALGMAFEGARGRTAEQMIEVINLPENDSQRLPMVLDLQSKLNPENVNYELSTANAFWLKKGEDLSETYQSIIEGYYLAGGNELDFRSDPEGSADTINEWVEEQTNGKIKNLITPSMITPLTYLILTNAIHFKANWKWQFDPEATIEEMFYNSTGGENMVEMMKMCDEDLDMNYADNDDVQMLQLPYQDEELSMYIMLPKKNDPSGLEALLDHQYVGVLKEDMKGEWIDLTLPKFKFEKKYVMNDPLINMGMEDAFTSAADFSGIKASGKDELHISLVVQKAFIDVNEEGTEAAAATAVIMKEDSAAFGSKPEPEPIEFRADHPFIFMIEHQATGQILFMGKVNDPAGV